MDFKKLYELSLLAEASYVQFDESEGSLLEALQSSSIGGQMSSTQASNFVDTFELISHQKNTENGFSATLFKNKMTGEYIYSCRGTEQPILDLINADFGDIVTDGLASKQIVDMYNDWKRLNAAEGETYQAAYLEHLELETAMLREAQPQDYESFVASLYAQGDIIIDEPGGDVYRIKLVDSASIYTDERAVGVEALHGGEMITVTGHSLGGHLATAFTRLFYDTAAEAVTINGAGYPTGTTPGLSGNAESNINNLFDTLGGVADFPSDRIINLYGEEYFEVTTMDQEWGLEQQGLNQPIFIEDTGLSSNTLGHGKEQMTDALAVYDLFVTLDPQLQSVSISDAFALLNPIFEAASDVADRLETYETLINVFGNVYVENFTSIKDAQWNIENGRETFYAAIKKIQDAIEGKEATVVSLVDKSTLELQDLAYADEAYRYALVHFSPFVISGEDYSRLNADGEFDMFDPETGKGQLNERYLADRVEMFTNWLYANTNDLMGDSGSNAIYVDLAKNISLNELLLDPDRKIFFGSEANETLDGIDRLITDNYVDRLYGMGGNDTLNGFGGDDYLEGGEGQDTLNGGDGADTFYIQGSDDDYDVYNGGDGQDTILGSSGNDTIRVHQFSEANSIEIIDGGAGESDIIAGTENADIIDLSRTTVIDIEHVAGGGGDDILIGSDGADHLLGGDGNDTLQGGINDYLVGTDVLEGGTGFDTYIIEDGGSVIIIDEDGLGVIKAQNGDTISGKFFLDEASGQYVWSKDPDVTISRNSDHMVLDYNGTQVKLDGLANQGLGIELVDFDVPATQVIENLDNSRYEWNHESDVYMPLGYLDCSSSTLVGMDGRDWFYGTERVLLDGQTGRDLLIGSSNLDGDLIYGGDDDDWIAGRGGEDVIDAGSGNDFVSSILGEATVNGGDGNDIIAGNWLEHLWIRKEFFSPWNADRTHNLNLYRGEFWRDFMEHFKPVNSTGFIAADNGYILPDWEDLTGNVLTGTTVNAAAVDYVFERYQPSFEELSISSDVRKDAVVYEAYESSYKVQYSGYESIYDIEQDSAYAEFYHAEGTAEHSYALTLSGDAGDDLVIGNQGNDNLLGGADNDQLFGHGGHDYIGGGTGDDQIAGGDGDDTIDGGSGQDLVYGETGSDLIFGGTEDDRLFGDSASELLADQGGDDIIYGDAGNDELIGQGGDDWLSGGIGDDTYIYALGDGDDEIFELDGDDTLNLKGVLSSEVTLAQVGNDVYVLLPDGGKIVIKEWANELGRVENIEFDGQERVPLETLLEASDSGYFLQESPTLEEDSVSSGIFSHPFSPEEVEFVFEKLPEHGDFNVDPDGTWNYTPNPNYSGTDSVLVSITDGSGKPALAVLSFEVTESDNDAPEMMELLIDQVAEQEKLFNYQISLDIFSDPDHGDSLSISASLGDGSALPSWLSFDASTGLFSGTPDYSDAGALIIKVTATDQEGLTVSDSFSLEVETLPVISGTDFNDSLGGTTGDDVIVGAAGNDFISAGDGSDLLYGGAGDDVLIGGTGNDFSAGGDGDDLYDINLNYPSFAGEDIINDRCVDLFGSQADAINAYNGYSLDVYSFQRDSDDLLISHPDVTTNYQLRLDDWFVDEHARVEYFRVSPDSDGVWTPYAITDLVSDADWDVAADPLNVRAKSVSGKENESIALTIEVEKFDPNESIELIRIEGLPDGFILSAGQNSGGGVWEVGADDLAGLLLTPSSDWAGNVQLSVVATSLDNFGRRATTTRSFEVDVELNTDVLGTDGDDILVGGDYSQYIDGYDGNDTLIGGGGDDDLYGGDGDDVYVYNLGDGFDYIEEDPSGVDTIKFGPGIQLSDLSGDYFYSEEWDYGYYNIYVGEDGGIEVGDWQSIEFFEFDDGSIYTYRQLLISLGLLENTLPEMVEVDLGSILEDNSCQLIPADLLANAYDLDGDVLTASDLSVDSGVLVDNADATWTYQPEADFNGEVTFNYSVSDGIDTISSSAVLNILAVNDAPVAIDSLQDQEATEGRTFIYQLPLDVFSDPDIGDVLTYTATLSDGSSLPDWLTFDSSAGVLSGIPSDSDVGLLEVVVTVTDSSGLSAIEQFELTVEPTEDRSKGQGVSGGGRFVTATFAELEPVVVDEDMLVADAYLTDADISQIIQDMAAYATTEGMCFERPEAVRQHEEVLAMVADSWSQA